MSYQEDQELSSEVFVPLYINESLFNKGDEWNKLARLQRQWDLHQIPLDADNLFSVFGKEQTEKYYSVTDVNGSSGGRGILVNERFFEHPICIGDFVSVLWADRIKLRVTNWAKKRYFE
tara:strand:- start:459 stop:815 length:357 start_codon:yes stop_codon:yes gene_type:complete